MEKVLLYFFLFSLAIITCSATTYTVGDTSGWDISTNLETWVADKKFKIGDALLFQYSSTYSVDEVTRENFETCNTSKVLKSYGNGNTTVPLTRAGDRYFVCGNRLYCLGGMKLHVHVDGENNDKAISPTQAPKAVAGSDQSRTGTLPSTKKSSQYSKGVAICARDNVLMFVYIALIWPLFMGCYRIDLSI